MRRDDGAAAVEYLGALVAAAALIAVSLLSVPATSPGLAADVRWAICKVLSVGLGDCSRTASAQADPHLPTQPCTVSSDSGAISRGGTILSGTGSAGNTYRLSRLSDGRYQVTEIIDGSLGVEAGVGEKVTVHIGDGTYGQGATAEASAVVNAQSGRVWYTDDLDEAHRMISTLRGDAIQATVVGGNPIADLVWWGGRKAVDAITDHDSSLPSPDEYLLAGGATVSASADVTDMVLGASASASDAQLIGVRRTADGDVTVFLQTTVETSVGVSAGPIGDSRGGSVSLVTAVSFDRAWDMTEVSTSTVTGGDAGHLSNLLFDDSTPTGQGDLTEYTATLSTRSDADRRTAVQFLAASGVSQLNLGPLGIATVPAQPLLMPATAVAAVPATAQFIGAARDHGVVTRQQFTDETGGFGAAAELELGLAIGGSLDYTSTNRTSVGASYWDGTAWVARPECS